MPSAIFQIDAFAARRFEGNPAAVTVMDAYPGDTTLQAHAAENNLSETAFLVRDGADYRLRWFTPQVEVPLCGHATLASAAVVMERLEPGRERVVFHTASGPLTVRRAASGPGAQCYVMDFPVRRCSSVEHAAGLAKALGVEPLEIAHDGFNYVARLADEAQLRALAPDMATIAALKGAAGVIVTAVGTEPYDIVSRYFAPAKGISEDPVTGGAHCSLAHFWSQRLGRSELRAWQASKRGGEMRVRLRGDRVELEGSCVFYSQGELC
ncbi:MAG: PhzF family phenazine biosynthesis protein [Paucibacter sp.]|nr:PhzF family phenazine biosynthesis protein [Roseateles sp.]